MKNAAELLEYAARHGLLQGNDSLEEAQIVAEETYRQLIERELLTAELQRIRELIAELKNWQHSA